MIPTSSIKKKLAKAETKRQKVAAFMSIVYQNGQRLKTVDGPEFVEKLELPDSYVADYYKAIAMYKYFNGLNK